MADHNQKKNGYTLRRDLDVISRTGRACAMTTPFGQTDMASRAFLQTKKALDRFLGDNKSGIATQNQAMELHERLCRQYRNEKIRQGICLRYSELKKKDTIDLRSMQPDPEKRMTLKEPYPITQSDEYINHLKRMDRETAFCNAIPPLSDCVFRLSEIQRVHVKVMEIDEPSFAVILKLDLYIGKGSGFDITTSTTIRLIFLNDLRVTIDELKDSFTSYEQNKRIPYEMLGWSKDEVALWEIMNEEYYKKCYESLINGNADCNQNECEYLCHVMMMAISVCNYMLENNKISTKRTHKPKEGKARECVAMPADTNDRRKVRTIGTMQVTSRDIPRRVTIENIRHYRTPIWKARGGIRHYKNGKTVRFKESIRVRKALADQVTPEQIASLRATQLRLVENDPYTLEKLHKTNNT